MLQNLLLPNNAPFRRCVHASSDGILTLLCLLFWTLKLQMTSLSLKLKGFSVWVLDFNDVVRWGWTNGRIFVWYARCFEFFFTGGGCLYLLALICEIFFRFANYIWKRSQQVPGYHVNCFGKSLFCLHLKLEKGEYLLICNFERFFFN